MPGPKSIPLHLLGCQVPIGHRVSPLSSEEVVRSSLASHAADTLVYGALNPVQRRTEPAPERQLELPTLPTVVEHSNCPWRLLGSVLSAGGGDAVFSVRAGGRVTNEVFAYGEEPGARGVAYATRAARPTVHVVNEGLVVVHPWSPALVQRVVLAPLLPVGVAGLFGG